MQSAGAHGIRRALRCAAGLLAGALFFGAALRLSAAPAASAAAQRPAAAACAGAGEDASGLVLTAGRLENRTAHPCRAWVTARGPCGPVCRLLVVGPGEAADCLREEETLVLVRSGGCPAASGGGAG